MMMSRTEEFFRKQREKDPDAKSMVDEELMRKIRLQSPSDGVHTDDWIHAREARGYEVIFTEGGKIITRKKK